MDVGEVELIAPRHRVVVDVGAGDGHAWLHIARSDRGTLAIALDPSRSSWTKWLGEDRRVFALALRGV